MTLASDFSQLLCPERGEQTRRVGAGGERHSGNQLLSGSVFRTGSGATWEKLVSSFHCHSSFFFFFF